MRKDWECGKNTIKEKISDAIAIAATHERAVEKVMDILKDVALLEYNKGWKDKAEQMLRMMKDDNLKN